MYKRRISVAYPREDKEPGIISREVENDLISDTAIVMILLSRPELQMDDYEGAINFAVNNGLFDVTETDCVITDKGLSFARYLYNKSSAGDECRRLLYSAALRYTMLEYITVKGLLFKESNPSKILERLRKSNKLSFENSATASLDKFLEDTEFTDEGLKEAFELRPAIGIVGEAINELPC